MKNFVLSLVIIAVISALSQFFLPWYIIAIVAFIAGYLIKQSWSAAFASGFLAIFILWAGYAAVLSHSNGDLLAHKVATLLPFHGHLSLLLLATGVIGGLVSGLASLSGNVMASK